MSEDESEPPEMVVLEIPVPVDSEHEDFVEELREAGIGNVEEQLGQMLSQQTEQNIYSLRQNIKYSQQQ